MGNENNNINLIAMRDAFLGMANLIDEMIALDKSQPESEEQMELLTSRLMVKLMKLQALEM